MATNRKKLNSMCIYDLMMKVGKNARICPVLVFSGLIPPMYSTGCRIPEHCDRCVRKWLDEESKPERR